MEINIENSLDHFKKLVRRFYRSNLDYVTPIILIELGFPAKLDGSDFVTTAILLYSNTQNGTLGNSLYAAVAAAHKDKFSPSTIEKSIRKAIKQAWNHRDKSL